MLTCDVCVIFCIPISNFFTLAFPPFLVSFIFQKNKKERENKETRFFNIFKIEKDMWKGSHGVF